MVPQARRRSGLPSWPCPFNSVFQGSGDGRMLGANRPREQRWEVGTASLPHILLTHTEGVAHCLQTG